jgi:hypothetical protein
MGVKVNSPVHSVEIQAIPVRFGTKRGGEWRFAVIDFFYA